VATGAEHEDERAKRKEIGARIRTARNEQGLTQIELADLLGISERSMQGYEIGEVIPYRRLHELSKVLQVSVPYLSPSRERACSSHPPRRPVRVGGPAGEACAHVSTAGVSRSSQR
jgi:transcriptional regulator with XRE-family HTH domain